MGQSEVADEDNMNILKVISLQGSQCLYRKAGAAAPDAGHLLAGTMRAQSYVTPRVWHGVENTRYSRKELLPRELLLLEGALQASSQYCLNFLFMPETCISKYSVLYMGRSCSD